MMTKWLAKSFGLMPIISIIIGISFDRKINTSIWGGDFGYVWFRIIASNCFNCIKSVSFVDKDIGNVI